MKGDDMAALAREIDWRDVLAGRIRAIQDAYPKAHHGLINWGRWSSDRRGIFPKQTNSALGGMFDRSGCDPEGWGEPPKEGIAKVIPFPDKAEARERLPYDEKTALILDERIHHPGGLNVEVRRAIRIAYVTREIPEDQFPRACGCVPDAFCERLEEALAFVRRFV